MSRSQPAWLPSARFVLRTPLLPFDELLAWRADLEGTPAELRAALRQRLREALGRAELREALFLASPHLVESYPEWERDPDGRRGRQVEHALVRYFVRMAGRSTPFGLFAGIAVGRVAGPRTSLVTAARASYARSTRLDNDYLFALAEALRRDPSVRRSLRWWPSSSAYPLAGKLRYAEARLSGKRRTHHLVEVERDAFVDLALRRAEHGATVDALVGALVSADAEIEPEEAHAFVDELIDAQLLVSDLEPAVTGQEPLQHMLGVLRAAAPTAAATTRLHAAAEALADIDAQGLGVSPLAYHAIAEALRGLPVEVDLARSFQVDLVKPAPDMVLGDEVLTELDRGITLLRRLAPPRRPGPVEAFARAFEERYGDREVPLLEALDEESGIGFEASLAPRAAGVPLLAGLDLPPTPPSEDARWGPWERYLLRRLQATWSRGERELVLTDAELEPFASERGVPLPDAMGLMATVAAASAEAAARGELEVLLSSVGGPSGAELLGRFCLASDEVAAMVHDHLRAEEALQPDVALAEIVHLNQGRIGNILCRPVLRELEIPYLGVSGAPPDRQLPVTDLGVSVRDGRVVLRSQRLDREVRPRMSTAHNYHLQSVGVYRFLCSLHEQEGTGLRWSFGPLEASRFLPRVRYGKVVLARARWRLDARDLAPLSRVVAAAEPEDAALASERRDAVFEAMQAIRRALALPRWVVLADGDNELPIDLDNPLTVESAAWLLGRREEAVLRELYPEPDRMLARGPEGRFVHELVLCLTPRREPARVERPARASTTVERRFAPGSQWMYVKLYAGASSADAVLREVVAPVRAQAIASGAASQWFFLRYRDSHEHLRVRFFGEPERLYGEVLPALHRHAQPRLDDGTLWRIALDTYEREVERYGGSEGIELAERIFHADSEAALAIIDATRGDRGADVRWRIALCGIDRLLVDLGMTMTERAALVRRARDGFRSEHRAGVPLFKQIGARFRQERALLLELLERGPRADADPMLVQGFAQLEHASASLGPAACELAARARAGRLDRGLDDIAWALVHMRINRLLHAAQRAQELVLHDLLDRCHASMLARGRASVGA